MRTGNKQLAVMCAGFWLLAEIAGAQEATTFLQPAQIGGPPATSTSQRFIFRDFGRADGTMLSTWAEDLTTRLENVLDMRASFHQLEIVRCSAAEQAPGSEGSVRMGQDYIEGLLQQWLLVVNPDQVEEEELLESMTQLLLNRYLLSIASRRGTGKEGMSLPDWLSIGLAQDLKPELRARNLEYARERNATGRHPGMATIVGLDVLPSGRSEEKVYCGLLIHWLSDEIRRGVTWPGVLQRLVAGKPVDMEWLAEEVLDVRSMGEAEQAWHLWLTERSENRPEPVGVSFEAVAALKSRLQLEVDDRGLPRTVAATELIAERGEEWARAAARTLETGLLQLEATGAPEVSTVAAAYARLMGRIAKGPRRGGVLGIGRSGVSTSDLTEELTEAEDLLVELEKDVAIRSHYLKSVGTEPEEQAVEMSTESLEEQRRKFLQEIRQQMGK